MPDSDTLHPGLHQRVNASFARQGMMLHLDARLVRVAPGRCGIALPYSDLFTQQLGQDGTSTDCAVRQQTLVPVPGPTGRAPHSACAELKFARTPTGAIP